jgi:hypothetical protein
VADRSSGPEIETQRKPRHPGSLIDAAGARSHFGDAVLLLAFVTPASARSVIDATGRTVLVPDRMERAMPGGLPAAVPVDNLLSAYKRVANRGISLRQTQAAASGD